MAINIRKRTVYILEGMQYFAWGLEYTKFIRLDINGMRQWYILDDQDKIVVDTLPDEKLLDAVFKESNGFLEQMELF